MKMKINPKNCSYKNQGKKIALTRKDKQAIKKNPSHKNYFITHNHSKEGILYYDGVGFSKLKTNTALYHSKTRVIYVARLVADKLKIPVSIQYEMVE